MTGAGVACTNVGVLHAKDYLLGFACEQSVICLNYILRVGLLLPQALVPVHRLPALRLGRADGKPVRGHADLRLLGPGGEPSTIALTIRLYVNSMGSAAMQAAMMLAAAAL